MQSRWPSALILIACLALTWPVVVQPAPAPVGWDDAHYLHRAACVTHALFQPSLSALGDCLALVVKAPLMAWLAWPWGPQAATASGIGLPFVSLAVLTFAVVIALAEVMLWLAIPWPLILLAFASLTVNGLMAVIAGAFEGDTLVSLLVPLLGLLVALELRRPDPGPWPSLARGLAWGAVIAAGVMAKTSFGYFAALLGPALLFLRLSRSGWAAGALAAIAALLVMAPVVAYHLLYWDAIVGHVRDSAVGPLAKYTSYGLNAPAYLATLAERWGWASAAVTAVLAAAVAWRWRLGRPAGWGWTVWPLVVLTGYLVLTALSENHDLRYGLPFLAGLPFALAALASAGTGAENGAALAPAGTGRTGLLAVLLAAVLVAVPMTQRPDLRYVREAQAALAALPPDQPLTVLMASDDSAINLDTLLLAQQLDPGRFGRLRIDTVVYDEAYGHSEAEMSARLEGADAVLLLKERIRKAPEWTNRHALAFRADLLAHGAALVPQPSPFLEVYRRGTTPPAASPGDRE